MLKHVLGIIALWLAILVVTMGWVYYSGMASPDQGEIVLEESPFCQFFVIRTPRGFVLAEAEREDVSLLGGLTAKGSLYRTGKATLDIEANSPVPVRIERVAVPMADAIAAFEMRCPDASVPLMALRPKS